MKWLESEYTALGFIVTACIGGVVGWIKGYEQATVETTTRAKCWSILRRVIMAGFAGWILYQFSVEYKISNAWGHILSGVVGMFAAEFFELIWTVGKNRLLAMTGGDKKP